MLAGGLLRVDAFVVDIYLENASPRGDQDHLFEIVLELLQDPLRQTDGSRRVPSLAAVLDAYSHAGNLSCGGP